jgi:hypothetical protein
MQAWQKLVSPCRGSVDGTLSSVLIFLLSMKTYRADVDVVHPLTRNSSRGGLPVLNSFSHRSPHEAPPHEGLLCWASVVGLPLGRSWAIEGAQEQVDRDTPVSRTTTTIHASDSLATVDHRANTHFTQQPKDAHNSTRNIGFGIKKIVSITGKIQI